MNSKNLITKAALYCRLSLDDGGDSESMSIVNQKAMLKDYCEKNGITEHTFYIDDGYTGRNFNRPGFQKMISDIENGKINCVITKDLSRLGRNYIETGSYIEVYFPRHNVRYIAINDNVDSVDCRELDITPFKNILNDMYSRDISKKVLTGWMARSRQGKFVGGNPPYGLMRDPNDNGHLIPNPETAPVVKLIFDLANNGYGAKRIAKRLMDDRIPISYINARARTEGKNELTRYYWGESTISQILRNPYYCGDHVVCKTHQKGIRSGSCFKIPREEWEIIPDCHEPIVTREQWNDVQRILDNKPRIMQGNNCPYYNIFRGIIFCADCGKSMQVRYEKIGRTGVNRTTKEERQPIDKAYFICQTYNRAGCDVCPSHKIEARDLHELVLNDIQSMAKEALKDSKGFYDSLAKKLTEHQNIDIVEINNEISFFNKRAKEIDQMIMSLYSDKVKGVITEQRFINLTQQFEAEQADIQERITMLSSDADKAEKSGTDARRFIDEILKCAKITELDEEITHRLINKILIGNPHKENGERFQEVRIVYNFVGEI